MAADPARNSEDASTVQSFRYAVIDLAVADQMRPKVLGRLRTEAETLFARNASRKVLEVGPWLVRLSQAPDIQRSLDALDPELPWGYYVYAAIDIVSLRQTLRRFNLVRLPEDGQEVLFRYWDPRVMRVFLQVANRDQRDKLFEFIDRIEAPDGSFDHRVEGR